MSEVDDQAARRAAMRRELLRANTAMAVVALAALGLALVAMFAGFRAARNLRRAEAAEAESLERLRNAYTAQARAMRASAEAGGLSGALIAISNAVAIQPSADLRSEATACLALCDLSEEGPLTPSPRDMARFVMDSTLRHFAVSDANGAVAIYNMGDGKLAGTLQPAALGPGMRMSVGEICFSPDGRLMAERFDGGAVVVWDWAATRPLVARGAARTNGMASGAATLTGLAFSTDSKSLFYADEEEGGRISMIDVASGGKTASGINPQGKLFRISADLKKLALATANRVDVLTYPGGEKLRSLTHEARVAMLDWSSNGEKLAVSTDEGAVYIWEPARDAHWHVSGHSERCMRMSFSPDGSLLFASSRDGTTRLWETARGQLLATGEGMAHTFSQDGRRIGFWRPWQGFGVWRIESESPYSLHPCDKSEGPLFSLDLSTSGRWCVATQNKGFHVWDLTNGSDAYFAMSDVWCVRVAPDEKSLYVCGRGGIDVWPLGTNDQAVRYVRHSDSRKIPLPDGRGARAIALSMDGHWAAVELSDERFFRMDLPDATNVVALKGRWRTVNFKGPASPTGAGRFAISPDGRWIVTGYSFDTGDDPKIWDGQTGECARTLPVGTSVVCFSTDGQWLGLGGMDRYSFCSVGDWKMQSSFPRDEPSITHGSLAFMPGSMAAIARTRQTVQLRDWRADERIDDLTPPLAQSVNALRVSLDGSTLVTATASDMVEVWRLNDLHRHLAAMSLDWGAGALPSRSAASAASSVGGWQLTFLASLAGFAVVAALALHTLRRHRMAIERFAVAEAEAAQRNRELDVAKAELMHSQKMQALGTLAAGIAHDFNNLLSVVRMSNKLIGRHANGDAEVQDHVADIEKAVLQGKSVVGSMLGYARGNDDAAGATDINAVVEDAVSLLSREFLRGIALTLELAREAPMARVGRGPLEQILLNLLVNASEAMQGEGRLKIVVRARKGLPNHSYILRPRISEEYIEMSVIDSGPGIAPEIRDRLFEPFFTTKRTGAKAGTGLGLSLVYSIAEQRELGLSVESEPGRGAAFSLVLPAEPSACAPDAQRQNPVKPLHCALDEN